MLFRNSILASFCLLPLYASSYQIHQSCVDKGVATDIRNGMTSAFEMVDSALRHLDQSPYDQDTADLIKRLFLAKNGQDVNDRVKMAKVRRIFRNINQHYRAETTGELLVTDVVIYCDDSRFVETGHRDKLFRKLYRDTLTEEIVLYKHQACHDPGLEWVSLMVTDNPDVEVEEWSELRGELVHRIENKPTVIMVCAWFVDWIKSKEYKLGNDVMRSNIGRAVVKKAEGNKWLRQIDALSLLDKVLLHEMTHGRSAFVGYHDSQQDPIEGTDDVGVPNSFLGIPIPFLPMRPAYGWKWARDLARVGDAVVGTQNWSPKAPDHNADSLALFGSAAKLLDHQWPRRVLDDGRIEPIGV